MAQSSDPKQQALPQAVARRVVRPTPVARPASAPEATMLEPRPASAVLHAAPEPVRPVAEQVVWAVDEVVSGRYRLLKRLGAGGMGEVWLADDLFLQRKVALKTLLGELAEDPEALERFRQEVAMAHAVIHPGLARTFDLGLCGGTTFLTMEYLEGECLAARLKRDPPLPLAEARRIASQVARAMEAAHAEGVVHRDLKPSNIYLIEDRGAVILDFGLAAAAGDRHGHGRSGSHSELMRASSEVAGTPYYMAPEQWRGEPQGAAVDIYALGVMLFELVTGRLPFEAKSRQELMFAHLEEAPPSPHRLRPAIPRALDRLIVACLAKEPGQRPAFMGWIADQLEQRTGWRHLWTALLALIVLLAVSTAGWALWALTSQLLLREMQPAVRATAESLALRLQLEVPPTDLGAVRTAKDLPTAAYRKIWAIADEQYAKNHRITMAYLLRLKQPPRLWETVMDVSCRPDGFDRDDQSFRCSPDGLPGAEWDSAENPLVEKALRTGKSQVEEDFISSIWGITLAGYAPLPEVDGQRLVVGVDLGNAPLVRLRLAIITIFVLLGCASAGTILAARLRQG